MSDGDLWEQFVATHWATEMESAYGPDWRNGHPEGVSAMLQAVSLDKMSRESESLSTAQHPSESMLSAFSPQDNALTFGSFQRESMDEKDCDQGEERLLPQLRQKKGNGKATQSSSVSFANESCRQLSLPRFDIRDQECAVHSQDELCRRSWPGSLPPVDFLQQLESHYANCEFEDLPVSEKIVRMVQESMPTKQNAQSGSRQERRKVKRSGGTKRHGEDLSSFNPATVENMHGPQLEHMIEITGTSTTFSASSRSVPSKQVSGITNQPSFPIPVDLGGSTTPPSAGLFHSFASSGNDNSSPYKSFRSSSVARSSSNSYPGGGASTKLFSFLGSGVPPGRDAASMDDWDMAEAGIAIDMDDPHHPHKPVHKHLSSDLGGKVGKSLKKQSRRHGSRQPTPMFSSRVSSNPLLGMTPAVAPSFARGNSDASSDTNGDSTNQMNPPDGLWDSKGKREDTGQKHGHTRSQSQSTKERHRNTQNPAQRHQQTGAPSKGTQSSGRSLGSGGRPSLSGRTDRAIGMQRSTGDSVPLSKPRSRNFIDRVDAHGRCPLHVAVMAGRADVVEVLLQYGCDALKVLPMDLLNQGPGQQHVDCKPLWSPPLSRTSTSSCEALERQIEESQEPTAVTESEQCGQDEDLRDQKPDASGLPAGDYCRVMVERPALVDRLSFKFCNALHLAAYFGHMTVVEILLKNTDIDPEAKNEHGCTALHLAANKGHKHIVTRLLKDRASSIDTPDYHGLSALHHAAAKGRSNIINVLWPNRGCKIDASDVMGWTALHYAAHAGHVDAVGDLIIAGCPVSKFDSYGLTPGHLAAYKGYAAVLEKLLHAGFYHDMLGGMAALRGCGGSTALHMAASKGHVEVIKQLLAEGANIHKEDFRGLNPLQCAAEGGHLESFNLLLEAGCNPKTADTLGTTLLHSAATGGNWDIVSKLLDLDCDPSVRTSLGKTLLHHAAQVGALKVTENLLRLGCDIHVPDKDDNMPWHAAAEGGNLDVLEIFLNRGCDIETKNKLGLTALHCAASSGSVPVVKALVDKGAVLRAVNGHGQTSLHVAAERGHEDVLLVLLNRVDSDVINCKDVQGSTVLHHVCDGRAPAALPLLIERGADVNAVNEFGQTPLHLATISHSLSIVEELLRHGCDASAKDADGRTALHFAAQKNDAPIFNRLFSVKGCNVADKDKHGHGLLHYAVEGGNPEIVGRLVLRGAAHHDQINGSKDVRNALHVACELGHFSVVKYLINTGYKVRGKGPQGMEPIHYACGAKGDNSVPSSCDTVQRGPREWTTELKEQHHKIVELLIEKHADVHVVDECGRNALMYAASVGDLELVIKFLKMRVDPAQRDVLDRNCMHWAAMSGKEAIIDELIELGVPVDCCDCEGRLPLHIAAEGGYLKAVCAFVDEMGRKDLDIHKEDAKGSTPVQLAATEGYVDIVTRLLEGSREKDSKGLTGLHLAIQLEMADIVKSLLKAGSCNVNETDADGCTPLHHAAATGQWELVEWLLKSKADMFISSRDGMMAIHRAANEGHLKAMEKLIDHGALRNYYTPSGSTPLHYAAASGRLDVIRSLLDKGIPVNQMSSGPGACTALYQAAHNGRLEAVNLLLEFNAEVDTICANECTALHVAASDGHTAVVKSLISAGAEVDLQASSNIAAIHNAVSNGHVDTAEALIAADCDTDIQNHAGNTPLHIAACKGSLELSRLMLNANCDIRIKNAKGYQAIHSAANNAFFDVVVLLVQHGAPWRQKGDLDVAKMLCRKSNLMPSYVDGRLTIAERPKPRKAKPTELSDSVPTEEEMKLKQAQADAVMAELLAEEEKEKKEGDQKQRCKRSKDRKKKNQSISEQKKEATSKGTQSPKNVPVQAVVDGVEHASEAQRVEDDEKSDKEEDVLESLPRVIMRGSSRRQVELPALVRDSKSNAPTPAAEGRQRKREAQTKQKKNRQPAPRPETAKLAAKPQGDPPPTSAKKVSAPIAERTDDSPVRVAQNSKSRSSSVTVIRRRTQGQAPIVKTPTAEVKKPPLAQASTLRELPSREPVAPPAAASAKKSTTALTRSISVPEARVSEKKSSRQASNRSLAMSTTINGGVASAKRPAIARTESESFARDGCTGRPPGRKADASHVWADAVKSGLDQKSSEGRNEPAKSVAASRKMTVKTPKLDSDVKVVNVSSNKRAFLPFSESTMLMSKSVSSSTDSQTGLPLASPADVSLNPLTSERTNETPPEEKITAEGHKEKETPDKVLKWVTKDLSVAASQNTDLRGTRVHPLTQKMKKLSMDAASMNGESSASKAVDRTEGEGKHASQTSHQNSWAVVPPHRQSASVELPPQPAPRGADVLSRTESPWKVVKKEDTWTTMSDMSGFPPLTFSQGKTSAPLEGSNSMPSHVPGGFPFPGGPIEWGMKSQELYQQPPPPPPPPDSAIASSHSWDYQTGSIGLTPMEAGTPTQSPAMDDGSVSFCGPPALVYQQMEQMDPDSLLPPELKEEITNGGVTSNHFRPTNSISSSRGSPTPNQSPSSKRLPYSAPAQSSPAWTKNAQGPYLPGGMNMLPMPTSPPVLSQSSSILSKMPDDPWEIDKVDITPLPNVPVMAQPPLPDAHLYEERMPYLCPLSRRPITDPVVAADGITYDRASIQEWVLVHDRSHVTGHALDSEDIEENMTAASILSDYASQPT